MGFDGVTVPVDSWLIISATGIAGDDAGLGCAGTEGTSGTTGLNGRGEMGVSMGESSDGLTGGDAVRM